MVLYRNGFLLWERLCEAWSQIYCTSPVPARCSDSMHDCGFYDALSLYLNKNITSEPTRKIRETRVVVVGAKVVVLKAIS